MSLTKVSFSMITGAFINVKDFGAVGDGVADDSAAIQAAVDAAKNQQINGPLAGSTTFVNGAPTVYFPLGVYRVNTGLTANNMPTIVLIGDGKVAIIGNTSTTKTVDFLTGDRVRYLTVENIQFQNFDTVFAVSSNNLDLANWNFQRCQAAGINLFIDTLSYVASRSTMVSFKDCVWQYNCVQIARIFCDSVTFDSCWIGSDNNSTSAIYANSNLSFYSCMFIPSGSTSVGRCAVFLTNDNGAGGIDNDTLRGVNFDSCRISNEGGQGPMVVCDFPVVNVNEQLSPRIVFSSCALVAFEPSPFELGNSESGVVYLLEYPAFVSFSNCSFSNVGAPNAKVIAKSDALTAVAPDSFGVYLDEPSFATANRAVGEVTTYTIAGTLRQYINNPDPYIYRNIIEGGFLNVVDTATAGQKKATFTLTPGQNDATTATPIAFFLYLGSQGRSTSNSVVYQAASVYIVTVQGWFDGSAKYVVTSTKLHGSVSGISGDVNPDIISLHFGSGDTGSNSAPMADSIEVTVAFGTNMNAGKARIETTFTKFSRFGSQPN